MPKKALRRLRQTAPDEKAINLSKGGAENMTRIGWQRTAAVEEINSNGSGSPPLPGATAAHHNFVTGWGENNAETTAGKLWSPEMSFVVDTSEGLGASANLIAESTVPPADPARAPNFVTPQGGYAVVVDLDSATESHAIGSSASPKLGRELSGPLATSRGRASRPRRPRGILASRAAFHS